MTLGHGLHLPEPHMRPLCWFHLPSPLQLCWVLPAPTGNDALNITAFASILGYK